MDTTTVTAAGMSVAFSSSTVLLMTIVHHSYGAVRFATPWRHHVTFVALLLGGILWGAFALWRGHSDTTPGRILRALFLGIALFGAIAWIGVFEGGYNHALKVLAHKSGAPDALLHRLYPPGIYEPVEDWFFETTDVAQLVLAVWAIRNVRRFMRVSDAAARPPHTS